MAWRWKGLEALCVSSAACSQRTLDISKEGDGNHAVLLLQVPYAKTCPWLPAAPEGCPVPVSGHVVDPTATQPMLSTEMTICFGLLWPSHCQSPRFLDGPFTRGLSAWLHSAAAAFQCRGGAEGARYQGTEPSEWGHGSAGRIAGTLWSQASRRGYAVTCG